MNKTLIIILLTGITLYISGQSDNEFWFAAPDVTAGHTCGTNPTPGHGRPVFINITAEQSTNVIIEMPGNPAFTPYEFSLSAGESRSQEIAPPFMPDIYENFPMSYPPLDGQTMQKKAFHITSYPGNITAYYELNNDCNRDIFALKGRNALGTDFYVSTQNYWNNGSYTPIPYSGFIIAATEDNTTIEISRNGQWQFFPGSPTVETIVLNRGETFAFVASSQDAAQHIMGVKVHANKKIAITWYDDSVAKGSCRDIIGDQLIPVNYIGRNYIVIKGDVQATNGGERFFVTATKNNTDVFVDGILKATLNEGQTYNEEIINPAVQIYTSHPAYVNHISGIGGGSEIGGATLPTIDGCAGSHKVSSKRSNNTIDPFLLNLMVRNDNNSSSPFYNKSIENFEIVTGVDTFKIPAFYFSFVNDSSWAYLRNEATVRSFIYNIITPGTTYSIINTLAKFHLGIQNGGPSSGGKYGYFSDYSYNRGKAGIGGSNAPPINSYCSLDSIVLVAEGGYKYKWFCQDSPGDSIYLSSTTSDVVVFKPADYGRYKFGVMISRLCSSDTVIYLQARYIEPPIAESDISKENACSGEPVTLINNTDMTLASAIHWTVGENINDSIAYPYIYTLVNNTESIIEKIFVLVAWGPFGSCPSTDTVYLKVFPEVKANFATDRTDYQINDTVQFQNLSEGYKIESVWDFGDGILSDEINPKHIYYPEKDTIFSPQLIVTDSIGCSDTLSKDLSLYYYLNSGFIASDSAGCGEFVVEFINQSIGAVSYEWDFGDGETSDIKNPIKSFTNTTDNDIWRKVTLITTGFSGNKDTSSQSIHIYPSFDLHINKDGKRLFEVFSENLCSYDSISVIDIFQSPYILKQLWEINETSFEQNSTIQAFTYPIPNNDTDSIETHKIKLTIYGTMSDACYTSDSAIVNAFPEVLADFYTDKTVYYSGDTIEFYNQSNRINLNYIWDFGDGTTKTDKDPFHQYQTIINSNFTVSLVVYSEFCKDTIEKELAILQQVSSFNYPVNESQILQVYPNPFDNYFSIQIKTEADESVKIEITNYEGKSIKTLANSVFKAGKYTIGSDCHELRQGMYFLKVIIGDNSEVFKLIKK